MKKTKSKLTGRSGFSPDVKQTSRGASSPTPDSSAGPSKFIPPTLSEVKLYCQKRLTCGIDPVRFFNYYQDNGWKAAGRKMKNWRLAVQNWERRDRLQQAQRLNQDITAPSAWDLDNVEALL